MWLVVGGMNIYSQLCTVDLGDSNHIRSTLYLCQKQNHKKNQVLSW